MLFKRVALNPLKTQTVAKTVLLVDFGSRYLRAAVVDRGPSVPSVSAFWAGERPLSDAPDANRTLLKEAVSALGLEPGTQAVLTWEEGFAVRQLTMPDMPKDELANALSWEMKNRYSVHLDQQFHGAQLGCQEQLPDGTREKLYTIYHSERKPVTDRVEWARAAGLDVRSVVPCQAALARTAGIFFPGKEVLVCEVGLQSARILVSRDGRQLLSRNVALGGKQLTDALKGTILVDGQRVTFDAQSAEALKIEKGAEDPQAAHIPLLRPYLERLLAEIRRSMDYYEAQKHSRPIQGVWFTGGGGSLKGLDAFCGQFLSLEVLKSPGGQSAPRAASAEAADWPAQEASLTGLLGAVLDDADSVSLLPKSSADGSGERLKRTGVRIGLVALALFLATLTAFTGARWIAARGELAATNAQWQEISRMGTLLTRVAERERFRRAALRGDLAHPALWKDLGRTIPDEVTLRSMEFSRESEILTLKGEVAGASGSDVKPVAALVSAMQGSGFFREVTLVSSAENAQAANRASFEIRCVTSGVE